MTNVEVVTDWKDVLLKREVVARARYIASLERSASDQLNLAKAYLSSLFGAIHGPGFARRIAWALSDERDPEKLRAATKETGAVMVARSIISQTGAREVDHQEGHVTLRVWVLLAQGEQNEDVVIIQRSTDTVRLSPGVTIRRRRPEDPEGWFAKAV